MPADAQVAPAIQGYLAPTTPDFRNEIRLGLVLYGGVSLATYINGVTQEFFNAVKGRGVYRLLKALTDSDIVVDILSGTSAGGINGILLAYALANDRDFDACARLWREHGDIQKLLRSPNDPAPPSVLDSEGYFQHHVEEVYRTLPPYPRPSEPAAIERERRWESRLEALDLFVTGTDFHGSLTTAVDSLNHLIDVKDHRRVFRLKYRAREREGALRPDQRNPHPDLLTTWDPATRRTRPEDEPIVKAVATLSRLTATFPGAFGPVAVRSEGVPDVDPAQARADVYLRRWGGFEQDSIFIDGGVLDNKPFSYTIRDIYYRTAERPVVRKLCYVEPDPERFARARERQLPDIVDVLRASLLDIPTYESIAEDLRTIDERNQRIQRYQEIVDAVIDRTLPEVTGPQAAPLPEPSATQRAIYDQSRVAALRDRLLRSLLSTRGGAPTRGPRAAVVTALAHRLVERFKDESSKFRADLLQRYDVDFQLRRLFFVTYYIYGRLETSAERPERYERLLRVLNRQIHALKVVHWALDRLSDALNLLGLLADDADANALRDPARLDQTALALWGGVRSLLDELLGIDGRFQQALLQVASLTAPAGLSDADIGHLRDILDQQFDRLAPRASRIGTAVAAGPMEAAAGDRTPTVLVYLDVAANLIVQGLIPDPRDPVRRVWDRFADIDVYVLPFEYLADLQEKDQITLVRISPLDARLGYSAREAADKLAGDTLYHFGGFFKRSWRSNDILWGRLDTVNLLLESLLEPDQLEKATRSAGRRGEIRAWLAGETSDGVFSGLAVAAALFPTSRKSEQTATVGRWLERVLSDDEVERRHARDELGGPDRTAVGGPLEALVWMAQREILEHEVPEVLTDAVDQSVEWGTRRRPEWYAFRRLFERFDVDRLAGAAVGHLAGRLYRRVPNLDRFFRDRYQVGSEDIARDIPPLILAQMLAQALLVFKNAVAGAVRHQRFARLLTPLKPIWSAAAWILWALYVVAIMVRRQSGVVTVLNTAITISSALLLWVGVRWRRDIWWTDDGLDLFWAAVFLLLPAVLLLAQAIYCRWWLQQRALLGAFFVISLLAGVGLVVYGATSGQYGFLHDWWARLLEGTRATFRSHEAAWFVWAPLGFLMVAWFARPAWFRR